MAVADFPSNLQDIIQLNMLERQFTDGLESKLAYRSICDREIFPNNVGETLTKTRYGLMDPVTTPLDPRTNTNLDNGMTPQYWSVEQYTMSLNQYGSTTNLNVVTQKVGIRERFLTNAKVLGIQATQSLDRIARNTLFDSYMGGNTRVRVALGAPSTTLSVDDIRGFTTVIVPPNSGDPDSGRVVPVSPSNPLAVQIGANEYNVVAFTPDPTNQSTAFRGISGTLTLSSNVSVLDGALNNPVISVTAPTILRPNGELTTFNLTASSQLTIQLMLDGLNVLDNNNVPRFDDGRYHMFTDPVGMRQLMSDPDFKLLYRGTADTTDAYQQGRVVEMVDFKIIVTNEAPQQTLNGVRIHRPYLCGKGSLIEGDFEGLTDNLQNMGDNENAEIIKKDGVAMVTRPPLDRAKQIIAQTWYAITGYAVPTDVTATTNIIPTATNSYLKRGLLLETGSA